MTPRVSSRRAAQLLGISTKTLANWRCEGKGPKGWTRLNKTLVVYRVDEIEAFLGERAAHARPHDDTPQPEVAP